MPSNTILRDFMGLVYPTLCACCSKVPPIRNHRFCTLCLLDLPLTDHFENRENAMMGRFWGFLELEYAMSLLYFDKGSVVQDMIHNLKYAGRKITGTTLGEMAGRKILEFQNNYKFDAIVPVPIHRTKMVKRGYNQSEVFAEAISQVTGIPVVRDYLVKVKKSPTQTDMGREERFRNVKNTFAAVPQSKPYEHYLLVDDVMTTGATLSACVEVMQAAIPAKYSVLTMVMARKAH